jgi:hypothetical protein
MKNEEQNKVPNEGYRLECGRREPTDQGGHIAPPPGSSHDISQRSRKGCRSLVISTLLRRTLEVIVKSDASCTLTLTTTCVISHALAQFSPIHTPYCPGHLIVSAECRFDSHLRQYHGGCRQSVLNSASGHPGRIMYSSLLVAVWLCVRCCLERHRNRDVCMSRPGCWCATTVLRVFVVAPMTLVLEYPPQDNNLHH